MTKSSRYWVNTAETVALCHKAMKSDDPKVVAAAESVLSAIVVTLRYETAPLPVEVVPCWKLLLKKVSNEVETMR